MTKNSRKEILGATGPESAAEMESGMAKMVAESAWTEAQSARETLTAKLRQLLDAPLNADQAARCASQIAKLRDDLSEIEASFRRITRAGLTK